MHETFNNNRFLTFRLNNEKYGFEILAIQEIIGYQKAIHIPRTPDYVKGVLNLRGKIIPVIDTAVKFGLPEKPPSTYTAIIITNLQNINIGFVVDEVNEVATVSEEQLSAPPEFGSSISVSYIAKMAQIDSEVIMILDLEKILDFSDLQAMKSVAESREAKEERERGVEDEKLNVVL